MKMFNTADYLIAAYSLLLLVGGTIGFIKSGSVISVAAGSLSALLLFISLYLKQAYSQIGYNVTYALLIALAALFTWRFSITLKFMPAGLLSILSIALLAYMVFTKK